MYYWEKKTGLGSPAVYTLIALNVVIWVVTSIYYITSPEGYIRFLYSFGVIPILITHGENLHTLITHMFLHDSTGILHILLNMYVLFLFGRDMEKTLGTKLFLVLYFSSGLAGALLHIYYFTYFFPQPTTPSELLSCFRLGYPPCTPSIGASGAIFGVMAGFAILYPTRPLMVFLGLFLPIAAPAIVVILILGVVQTLFMLATPFSSIAYTAHVGGFITGLLTTLLYKKTRRVREDYFYPDLGV